MKVKKRTVCLSVVGRLSLFDVFVEVRLLLGVTLPVVFSAVLAALHRTQAFVNALIVVACGALVVCLARFPLEALECEQKNPV